MDTDISGSDKGTRKARKAQKNSWFLILSVSSVISVWDKKWHTEATDGHGYQWVRIRHTESTENVDIMRDNFCEFREFCVGFEERVLRLFQEPLPCREDANCSHIVMNNLILVIGDNCPIRTSSDRGCFANTSEFAVASHKKIPTFLK